MSEAIANEIIEDDPMIEEVPVLDDSDAEYLLKRIREAEEEYDRMEAWYKRNLEKLKEKRDSTRAWAERNLWNYFQTVPTKKTKTGQEIYDLPGGKLVLKHQEPEYDQDDATLVKWLKENQLEKLVKVTEKANWAELKKQLKLAPDGKGMVTKDGEVVPGITVTVREDKFMATARKEGEKV